MTSPPTIDTVASLIDRLGPVPPKVLDHWCDQLRQQLAPDQGGTEIAEHELRLDQFQVDAEGGIVWIETFLGSGSNDRGKVLSVDQAERRFRDLAGGGGGAATRGDAIRKAGVVNQADTASDSRDMELTLDIPNAGGICSGSENQPPGHQRSILIGTAIAAGLGAAAMVWLPPQDTAEVVAISAPPKPAPDAPVSSAGETAPLDDNANEALMLLSRVELSEFDEDESSQDSNGALSVDDLAADPIGEPELNELDLSEFNLGWPRDTPLQWMETDSQVGDLEGSDDEVAYEHQTASAPAGADDDNDDDPPASGNAVDPVPLMLADHDQRIDWPISRRQLGRGAELDFDVRLTDGLVAIWLMPIDGESAIRARGIVLIQSAGANGADQKTFKPAIALRIDVRTGSEMSARLRYAARLDPASAWHTVNATGLDQLAALVTSQAVQVDQVVANIKTIYSDANPRQRSKLRSQRDAAQARSRQLSTAARQIAALADLIEQVESGSTLAVKVTRAGETILETVP